LALVLSLSQSVQAQTNPITVTEVLVVASMHRLHANAPNFGFDRLYSIVERFKPDVVGVEIRPEDIRADPEYLSKSYPPEMIALRDHYRDRIVGFDWLGPELAGKPIPADWWAHGSKIKALERELGADPKMSDAETQRISEAQREILKSATPASLTNGRYYRLVRKERAWLARHAGDGPYREYIRFNDARERHIDANLAAIVRANPGRRIVFVMGADHHGFAVDSLRAASGSKIRLVLPE